MEMTNDEHRELIRNANAMADKHASNAENAIETRAIVEATGANTEALILLGKIIEPIAARIIEMADRDALEEQNYKDSARLDFVFGQVKDFVTQFEHGNIGNITLPLNRDELDKSKAEAADTTSEKETDK